MVKDRGVDHIELLSPCVGIQTEAHVVPVPFEQRPDQLVAQERQPAGHGKAAAVDYHGRSGRSIIVHPAAIAILVPDESPRPLLGHLVPVDHIAVRQTPVGLVDFGPGHADDRVTELGHADHLE